VPVPDSVTATALSDAELARLATDIQRRVGVRVRRDVPLARYTTMRVGGPADLFVEAHHAIELRGLVRLAAGRGVPLFLIGRGSDLVIGDRGIRGLVVQVRSQSWRVEAEADPPRFVADAGVPMARAATETQRAGLGGLEFGLAIPGTVGGAVWANAGAHGDDVAGVIASATVLGPDGGERVVGLAFHGRGGDADLERFAVQPGNGAFLCPWLCVDADQPALVCFSEPAAQNILDTVSASVPTGISSTCATMSTNSGDRSMFPIGGMKRRNTR